jgi:hypothetical protein
MIGDICGGWVPAVARVTPHCGVVDKHRPKRSNGSRVDQHRKPTGHVRHADPPFDRSAVLVHGVGFGRRAP